MVSDVAVSASKTSADAKEDGLHDVERPATDAVRDQAAQLERELTAVRAPPQASQELARVRVPPQAPHHCSGNRHDTDPATRTDPAHRQPL
jgi:hypothetical protein